MGGMIEKMGRGRNGCCIFPFKIFRHLVFEDELDKAHQLGGDNKRIHRCNPNKSVGRTNFADNFREVCRFFFDLLDHLADMKGFVVMVRKLALNIFKVGHGYTQVPFRAPIQNHNVHA